MKLLLPLSALVFFLAASTCVSAVDMTDRDIETEDRDFETEDRGFETEDRDFETEDSLWSLYELWMSHYNVSRDLDEKQKRFNVFKETARYVHDFNKRKDGSHKLRLYEFSDLTLEEFQSTYTGYLSSTLRGSGDIDSPPSSVDQRQKGDDQGQCGSCWSTTASTHAPLDNGDEVDDDETGSRLSQALLQLSYSSQG